MRELPTGRKFTRLFTAILAAAIALAYCNSLGIGFEFDDIYVIVENPAVRSLRNIPSYFYDPLTLTTVRENADLRPILQISYALNYAVSGLMPWSYHVFNIILHFVASLLVFVIVRDHLWWPPSERGASGAGRLPAAASALFFALAPLNSESLDYHSARSALLCTALYLGAFLSALRGRRWLTGLLHTLALLTKAIAVTLPGAILVYDYLYRDRQRSPTLIAYLRDWRRPVRLLMLPVLLDAAYLVYRHFLIPPWVTETYKAPFTTPLIWFMTEWSAELYYVRLFLFPDALSIDHDLPYAMSFLQTRAWLALAVIVVWILATLRYSRRNPLPAFATLWFFLTLAPESTFAPLAEVINNHRPYIASSLGLSVLLTLILYRVTFDGKHALRFPAVCLAVCAAAVPVTLHRNWQWQDSVRLWLDAAEKDPQNGRAWLNAGDAALRRNDLVSARRYIERGREVSPNYVYTYLNLSELESAEGHYDAALRAANQATRLQPDLAFTHYYRGIALEKLGRIDEAAGAYQEALLVNPRDADSRAALDRLQLSPEKQAESLMRAGLEALRSYRDAGHAVTAFRKVLELNPKHYAATYQLAAALDAAGHRDEARPFWLKAHEMAEGYLDEKTAADIRRRLER